MIFELGEDNIDKQIVHISKKNHIPFIEKYKPRQINDLILPLMIKTKLNNIINSDSIPNIIISGPSGIGKTCTISCLIKQIFGNDKTRILEFNDSNKTPNRTLEYIKTTVYNFCKQKLKDKKRGNIDQWNQKIIIFDEADGITYKAQNILSTLIEKNNKHVCFAFTCNDANKIIEPIQSRCIIIKYSLIQKDNIIQYIKKICLLENIKYTNDGLAIIADLSKGDIRIAINSLETINNSFNIVNKETVLKIFQQPNVSIIKNIIVECFKQNIDNTFQLLNELKQNGYCNNDILIAMYNFIIDFRMEEDVKIKFIEIISEYCMVIADGLDTNLQLYACIAKMVKYMILTNK